MHPPRDDFIATMTDAERSAFDGHAAWLRKQMADGVLIVSGPCLGQVNTGITPTRVKEHRVLPTRTQDAAVDWSMTGKHGARVLAAGLRAWAGLVRGRFGWFSCAADN
jgi:hypothetical protein